MAKITRIKASDPGKTPEKEVEAPQTVKRVKAAKDSGPSKKAAKTAAKAKKAHEKADKKSLAQKESKNYFKNAWLELRQVRWPSKKATWKMVLAIFVYTGIFIAIIMLLDALFTWLFGIILG